MDCAGKAPAATALSPTRASRELFKHRRPHESGVALPLPAALQDAPRPDRGCVADQPQRSAEITASEILDPA